MPLYRIIFFSQARFRPESYCDELDHLVRDSRARHAAASITGMLVASPNYLLQVIEGRRARVSEELMRLACAGRSSAIELIEARPVDERVFPEWSNLFLDVGLLPASDVRRFAPSYEFDPTHMTPTMALSFLKAAARHALRAPALLVDDEAGFDLAPDEERL
jgi:hypothetical protein